jgi:hypothetical protein
MLEKLEKSISPTRFFNLPLFLSGKVFGRDYDDVQQFK